MQKEKRAMIFDLDGTLCNTIDDLADCCNRALAEEGFPAHTPEEYKYIVGNGIDKQIMRAIPSGKYTTQTAERVKSAFKKYYSVGYNIKTKAYDKMPETLEKLAQMGFILITFSNKPQDFTCQLCEYTFPKTFAAIIGNVNGLPLKPNPKALLKKLHELEINPENCLYCGDTGTDMQTAVQAKIPGIGALWGFRTREELVENGAVHLAASPLDLIEIAGEL